jgi:hypothetical protein
MAQAALPVGSKTWHEPELYEFFKDAPAEIKKFFKITS